MNTSHILKHYLTASMVIGIFQIIDGASFALGFSGSINTAYSYVEILWFIVSVIFIFVLNNAEKPIIIPVVYMGYLTLNTWLASEVFARSNIPPGYEIPLWFTFITIGVGMTGYLLSFKLYRQIKNGKSD